MPTAEQEERILKGIAASPGVAHGPAFLFLRKEFEVPSYQIPEDRREEEVARFELGLLETRKQISLIRAEIAEKLGEDEAQIFDAHLLVLEDRALIEETIREVVDTGFNIEYCFQRVATRYIDAFSNIDDDYIKERVSDIRDVSRRLLHNLMGRSDSSMGRLSEQTIIVADDVTPSDSASLERSRVLALVTDQGSRTSHAVIMARSISVPAVVGLHDITGQISTGDHLLVDGYDGVVIINPTEQSLYRYGQISVQRQNIQRLFLKVRDMPAQTRDGHTLTIRINADGYEDAGVLRTSGGNGVGLFRTEGLFLRSSGFPDEEEQYRAYRRVVEAVDPGPVVIRTLDLGGDKIPRSGFVHYEEANPFLGYRALRYCLEHQGVFRDQLRAILRASAHGDVRVMYPMVTNLAELLEANRLLESCKTDLKKRGQAFRDDLPVGCMIEVPAAALIADQLARHCVFFSVGTNDLIQYLMAVDRLNDRIAHLYDPAHPAVLRTLANLVEVKERQGIHLSVCGEMAAEGAYALLLYGLGVDELSVVPSAVPELKYLVRNMVLSDAKALAKELLEAGEPAETVRRLQAFYRERLEGTECPPS